MSDAAGDGVAGFNSYLWLRLYGPGRVAVRSAYGPSETDTTAWASQVTVRRMASTTDWYFLRDGQRREYWAVPWRERYIWGATAGMLRTFRDVLLTPATP